MVAVRSSELKHGLRSTYVNKGCRCSLCRKANADYKRYTAAGYRSDTAALADAYYEAFGDELIPTLAHGLRATYEWRGCRCEECRAAMRPIWKLNRELRRLMKVA